MKVLVIGSGSREHAIVWKLSRSPLVDEILAAPGNAGTHAIARSVPIAAEDVDALQAFAQQNAVDFTVVGPEAPLAMGIADMFTQADMPIFGPTQAAARIESSKAFAKRLMLDNAVPTAAAKAFTDYDTARAYVQNCPIPIVIKADGLAAGKGVAIARTRTEALDALRASMRDRRFGDAGECVLVEEYMQGKEVSVFAFVDGAYVSPMVAARDYKRAYDGDRGPNTGGMGSYSPPAPQHWNPAIEAQVRERIMQPIADALVAIGSPYKGALYLGMMLTSDGPKVVEFNCRLGDPETQVILPRLKTDLAPVMLATARGELDGLPIQWDDRACVGVVIASGGYPGPYTTGHPISGIPEASAAAMVFHAGTKLAAAAPAILTDGGRVLTVAALADTIEDARRAAYAGASRIRFDGAFYRTDIAAL